MNGAIHATYDGASQTVALRDTTLRIPSTTLTAQGTISNHSSLQIHLAASDLHQLAALAASFQASKSQVPAVSGSATLNAVVSGSLKKPTIAAQLDAENLHVQGSEWKSASFEMNANPSQFTVQNGSLVNAHRGRATFNASIGLGNWSYQDSNRIEAHLDVQQMRIADLERLANQQYAHLRRCLGKDLAGRYRNWIPWVQVRPDHQRSRLRRAPSKSGREIQASNSSIVSTLNLSVAAGEVDANLSYTPKTKAYKVRLDAPSVVLQKLQTVQAKNLPLTGTVTASVNGEGTLDDPQLIAVIQFPQLQVRQNSISGLKAELNVAHHYADLNLNSKVSEASVRAHGRVALSGNYYTEAVIDTNTVPLDVLLATYAPSVPKGFQGQTELHATLKGPLKDKSQVEAHLSIPVLQASYQSLQIGIRSPIRADYSHSVVTLQPAEFRGTGTSIHVQGQHTDRRDGFSQRSP